MNKINKGTGAGGSRTNLNGIKFEEKIYLKHWIESVGYKLTPVVESTKRSSFYKIYDGNKLLGYYGRQSQIYSVLKIYDSEKMSNAHIKEVLSKKINPDAFILSLGKKTLTIFEKKWQQTSGSVDEKIQTAPFKLQMFEKLLRNTDILCQYQYILSSWFADEKYRNVKEYYSDKEKINVWVENENLDQLNVKVFI